MTPKPPRNHFDASSLENRAGANQQSKMYFADTTDSDEELQQAAINKQDSQEILKTDGSQEYLSRQSPMNSKLRKTFMSATVSGDLNIDSNANSPKVN